MRVSSPHGKTGFQLNSLSCENCDSRLGRYACNDATKPDQASGVSVSWTPAALPVQTLLRCCCETSPPFLAPSADTQPCCVSCHSAALQERQLLLAVTQSVTHVPQACASIRQLRVTLPAVTADGGRVVWCPRCPPGSRTGWSQPHTEVVDAVAGERTLRLQLVVDA